MPIKHLLCKSIKDITEEYFNKTERVFSYELYHVFKINLINDDQLGDNLVLDAELPKRRLSDAEATNLGLIDLGKLMSPDIIVHERDTANHQLLVAEIKVDQSLRRKSLIKDINKLISLKMNYNFQYAIFISVNSLMDKIERYLNDNNTIIVQNNDINQNDDDNLIILPDNIDIDIITKKSANNNEHPLEERTLRQILNLN